jgi:hypothetical protein
MEALVKALLEPIACCGRERSDLVFLLFVADELLDRDAGSARQANCMAEKAYTSPLYPLMDSSV